MNVRAEDEITKILNMVHEIHKKMGLEDKHDEETLTAIVKNLYSLKSIPDPNVPDPKKAKRVLDELKELCGTGLIEKEIEERKRREKSKSFIDETKSKVQRENNLAELNKLFSQKATGSRT